MSRTIQPGDLQELRQQLSTAVASSEQISAVDLRRMNRLLSHAAEDMTVSVEAGITLEALQTELAKKGQWLPVDPPDQNVTIKDLLDYNLSGPRRYGYGTIREYLIGIGVVLADGKLVRSGGQVVKNVAGYDLQKLFVGARGTLGVIVEATFKLRPLPEKEVFLWKMVSSLKEVEYSIEEVLNSETTPIALDVVRLKPDEPFQVVVGFAGTREEVEFQAALMEKSGFLEPAALSYENEFWQSDTKGQINRVSVLASELVTKLGLLGDVPFIARAGNGIIYYRGSPAPPNRRESDFLMRRVKETFDTTGILRIPLNSEYCTKQLQNELHRDNADSI